MVVVACWPDTTSLMCKPAGIRARARVRAMCVLLLARRDDDGEKLEQYSSEREEEAHTHTRVVPEKPPQSSDGQYIIFFVKLHRISKFC